MDTTIDTERLVVGTNSQGLEIRGTLRKLSRYHAAFEVYQPGVVLRLSEVLSDCKIVVEGQPVYTGRAVLGGLVNTGTSWVCELTLSDCWTNPDPGAASRTNRDWTGEFRAFLQGLRGAYKITSECKVLVADMVDFFTHLNRWLQSLELERRSGSKPQVSVGEPEAFDELAGEVLPAISTLFDEFEALTERLEPALQPAHHAYLRRHLHPLLLCAPFAWRTFAKPLGYAGDYDMVNRIVNQAWGGESLFARLLDRWFLEQAPAAAHRNRVEHLVRILEEETARAARLGGPLRVFNLGCGPAAEVQRFLAEESLAALSQFTLVDFNEETLLHVTAALDQVRRRQIRPTPVQVAKRSVNQLLKEASRPTTTQRPPAYDLVYCAGLFDYLPDEICRRLMTLFYDWVAPGGLVLATNVHPSNPRRHTMASVLDWHLIYRDAIQAGRLMPGQAPPECCMVHTDLTGVNVFMEARKPSHAAA